MTSIRSNPYAPILLVGPYKHRYRTVRERRLREIGRCANHLLQRGLNVFSLAVWRDAIDSRGQIPDHRWTAWAHDYLSVASRLYILKEEKWKDDELVTDLIATAYQSNIPVLFLDPQTYMVVEG